MQKTLKLRSAFPVSR